MKVLLRGVALHNGAAPPESTFTDSIAVSY